VKKDHARSFSSFSFFLDSGLAAHVLSIMAAVEILVFIYGKSS